MDALRRIIDSKELEKVMSLPSEFRHRKLELVVLPADDVYETNENKVSARGTLNRFKNIGLIKEEGKAWEEAIGEKYGNS